MRSKGPRRDARAKEGVTPRRGAPRSIELALEAIGQAIVLTDGRGRVVWCNTAFQQLIDQPRSSAVGGYVADLLPLTRQGAKLSTREHPVQEVLRSGLKSRETYEFHRHDRKLALDILGNKISYAHNRAGAVLAILDATDQKKAEARLEELAYYDPLTGLPNRRFFLNLLTQALARASRKRTHLALLFLDLDRFKLVNDMLGHSMGDILLKNAAQRIGQSLRTCDILCRLGGDEFTVIVEDMPSIDSITQIAQRILAIFAAPFNLEEREFYVTVSIGIAVFPGDGTCCDDLVKRADMAMYAAKEFGAQFCFYSREMQNQSIERLSLETGLRRALERDEFRLHYQPIIDVPTKRLVGVEALLRWQHPERGLLLPEKFIRLAEEGGLIVPIGEWVLRTACAQTKQWQTQGLPDLRVSVNLSCRQLGHPQIVQMVAAVLHEVGLSPQHLELELTERMFLQDTADVMTKLQALHRMGIRLSIDDFGTQYSSLAYLRRLPIRGIKIDRLFMKELGQNSDDGSIVSTIIAMARSLRLNVIAEGVETLEQVSFLCAQACNEMQGYYFGGPVPPEAFLSLPIFGLSDSATASPS